MTRNESSQPAAHPISAKALVERLGPHPATLLGIDLRDADDGELARWLWLAALLASRDDEDVCAEAFRALQRELPLAPADLAKADPAALTVCLASAELGRPDVYALRLHRLATALSDGYGGSLTRLASQCDGLGELGQRLVGLASGFGAGAASRFLAPLRAHWPGADELPLDANARAAAIHLGWLEAADASAEAPDGAALRAGLEWVDTPGGLEFHDVEAALARLGRLACRRDRAKRCPLATACPIADEPV